MARPTSSPVPAMPARLARPGLESIRTRGWLAAHKWLLLRRIVQLSLLSLFLLGPWFGIWLVKGNLTSSLTLGVLPLSDPYALLQSLAAGHWPYKTALIGAAIVLAFYLLLGGRVFCGWVCPVNLITDSAAWSRRRLGLKTGKTPAEATRRWLLGATLVASALTGSIAWEWVNPVSFFHRSLFFGWGLGWLVLAAVFVYDLTVARGWCGHLCPMGAFYGLLGKTALARVSAPQRARCNDCMDCFTVCPEPQVIRPALKGSGSLVILSSDCTTCGRCVDVCAQEVFRFSHRFDQRSTS